MMSWSSQTPRSQPVDKTFDIEREQRIKSMIHCQNLCEVAEKA